MVCGLRSVHVCGIAALTAAAVGGPAPLAHAIAATAGTLFEAAPFVVVASVLERTRFARIRLLVSLMGCGCTRGPVPGALAVAAIALCALAFGPAIAAVRVVAAIAIAGLASGRRAGGGDRAHTGTEPIVDDAFQTLLETGAAAFVAALVVDALAKHGPSAHLPAVLFLAGGLLVGSIAPCATAGIAIASAFVHTMPTVAAGVLATTGLLSIRLRETRGGNLGAARRAPIAALVLAGALALIVIRGPSGLVNPRLLWPIGIASAVIVVTIRTWRTRNSMAALVPASMILVLIAPQAPESYRATATDLADAFPGERLTFTGSASGTQGATTLSRYAITCCRIDARQVSVRLDRSLEVTDGSWIEARGTLARTADGSLVLHPATVRALASPRDPYLYL